MKKLLALLLVAVLFAGAIPVAGASGGPKKVERVDVEEYTWEEALSAIRAEQWEGIRYTLKDCNLKYWAPTTMAKAELTEEAKATGYLAWFVSADDSLTLAVTRSTAVISLEDFQEGVEEYGAEKIHVQKINGLDWLLYEDPAVGQKPQKSGDYGVRCLVASLPTEKGVVEFVFYAQSKEAAYLTDVIMASIEPVEQPQ